VAGVAGHPFLEGELFALEVGRRGQRVAGEALVALGGVGDVKSLDDGGRLRLRIGQRLVRLGVTVVRLPDCVLVGKARAGLGSLASP
jgi:hypothetical protein